MSVKWSGDSVLDKVARAAMIGIIEAANIVHAEGTRLMQESPRGGKVYVSKGRTHKASAPGEPPAVDTGSLVQSGVITPNYEDISATVKWTSDHAEPLEFGTDKMEPRPFARPAVANKQKEINDIVASRIAEALKS